MSGPDLSGSVLDGRYQVIEPIAEGAMGSVYRGERLKLGKAVAIKIMHDALPDELASRQRFEREAKLMARLEHPHCVSVIDFGLHDARPFLVMDLVRGTSVQDLLEKHGHFEITRAVDLVRQVLSGLGHAHELGVVHRDIKPANIMLAQKTGLGEQVRILDFGLARPSTPDTAKLTTGIVVGTPNYMAPEQIKGSDVDGRADLYASAVVLFELVTGRKPFVADDPIAVVRKHLNEPAPTLASVAPNGDFVELEPIIARGLAKEPKDRFSTAAEMSDALEKAMDKRGARQVAALMAHAVPSTAQIGGGPHQLATPSGWNLPQDSSAIPSGPGGHGMSGPSGHGMSGPGGHGMSGPGGHGMSGPTGGQVATGPTGGQVLTGPASGAVVLPPGVPSSGGISAPIPLVLDNSGSAPVGASVQSSPHAVPHPNAPQYQSGPTTAPQYQSGPTTAPQYQSGPTTARQYHQSGPQSAPHLVQSGPHPGPSDSQAATSLALNAVPQIRKNAMTDRPIPQLPLTRRQLMVAGGGLVLVIIIIIAVSRGGAAAKAVPDAAVAQSRPDAPAGDPIATSLSRASDLYANGDLDSALDIALKARRYHPESAQLAFLTGKIYFAKLYWTDGLKNLRDAIRLDAGYRTDPELIKIALRGFITTPDTDSRLEEFLRLDIGEAAKPYLEETAHDNPNATVRARASAELRRFH